MKHLTLLTLLVLIAPFGWGGDNSVTTVPPNTNASQIEVTLLFTVLLSVFLIVLSFRVLDLRGSPVTKWLHPADRSIEQETLDRAIRGHGNLIEYAPMFLFLMLCLELQGASKGQLLLSGTVFTIGRFMHGIVFSFMRPQPIMRIGGMALTFTGFFALIWLAISVLRANFG